MKIYLDNCCYNRPYDDQSQMRIHLDTQAKLHIQNMIKQRKFELVTSYILDYENSKNRSLQKKMAIDKFMKTGVKEKDAYHVACAVMAECKYFITTDDRLLKYQSDRIILVTPGEFIRRVEEIDYD